METDEIYAPIAYRLGMQNLSGEFHDLAFPYLKPKEDKWLKDTVPDRYNVRLNYLKKIKPLLEQALADHNLKPQDINFRAKRYSSLYEKLTRHNMDIEKIYDLVAMRVIMENIEECYGALGVVHQIWPPVPARIKDYIAMPKPNGYRSLHTTVIGPENKLIEIQIRTKQMHEENENGVAAHWIYAQGKGQNNQPSAKAKEEIKWVEQLRNWLSSNTGSDEFLQSMKVDFFKDRIFAISPRGDVIDLPAGSTPIDFAYQVHSDVGNTAVGARVNGGIVPLSHVLQSGDMVEILTQKNKRPSEGWLQFVKTSGAREHIKAAMREKDTLAQSRRLPTKAELRIVAKDRIGLLKDILAIISRSHLNIIKITTVTPPGSDYPIDKIEIGITNKDKLDKLVLKIKQQIKEVKEIGYQLI